ncbi:MAG: 23S rRNA (uracil(1939)-C(5))-methyltransferase RlmD [Clostridia bacterium]|nr:23S rRNA (uracil(1939)-C(5))-methyltransferase RlmD [Clostridia bacterium]
MKKGDRFLLDITDINNLGCGVGRHEGIVVFVKGAVTDDRIETEIIKVTKNYLVGRLLKLISPSPFRSEAPFCQAPMSCGGCVYRNISYDYELKIKEGYVRGAFDKAGLSDVTVLPTLSAGKVSHYRNKGQYPVRRIKGEIRAGFFASKTHNVIPFSDCEIQNETFAKIVDAVCRYATENGIEAYDEEKGTGLLRHIYLRVGEKTGQIMLCLVINGNTLPQSEKFVEHIRNTEPNIVSVMLNSNKKNTNVILGNRFVTLFGKDYIEDELCGLKFKISADSFYQVNRDGAELLYSLAAEAADLDGHELLLDLYCGTGTIGLSMSDKAEKLIGIEIVGSAVECAKENARANNKKNAEFYCADAGDANEILKITGGRRPDVVVIDPPRKGSTEELVECLAKLEVPKVVYVSCDPDTLARDCVWFRKHGYSIGDVRTVDMFPRTGHVESVVCLTKKLQ